MKKLLTGLVAACCLCTPLAARTPAAGSAERKAILDALRPSVEARIGPNVEFVVSILNVEGNWAFVHAEPRRKGGKQIDGRAYFPHEWDDMDGITSTAILRYQNKRWNLVESAIGATDAWYCGMPQVRALTGC
jgi:hypothetical protein